MSGRYDASDRGIQVRVDDDPAPRSGVASKSNRHAVAAVQAVTDGRGSALYAEGHSTLAPATLVRGYGELARWERWNGTRWVTSATLAADGTLDVEDITVQGAAIEGAGPLEIADIGGLEAALAALVVKATFPVTIGIACSDETTALTTGTAKATFRMPHAMTLTAVRASLTTASSSGAVTIDINEGTSPTTVLSTKLTIDQGAKTSTTAGTPAVISDASLADDAQITVDIDGAGATAAGLKVWLIGTRVIA